MSWDISVFATRVPPPPVAAMPSDWRGEVLGTSKEVRDQISLFLPGTDWTEPTWGIFQGDGFSYEFNIGDEESNAGFMIHVRGGGDAVSPLLRLAKCSGWFLLDCSQGEWLHHCENTKAGWQGFQAYRDSLFPETPLREFPDSEQPTQPKKSQ
jgi:hypothetical protein